MPRLDADLDLYDRIKMGLINVHRLSRPVWRFWKQVNKDGPIHPVHGQCWIWTGCKNEKGYGKFNPGFEPTKAHRFSYEEFVGPIPHSLWVLHQCDNPSCVRPAHLFLGTNKDNTQDKMDKDRHVKGETNGRAILTEEDVREIRRRYRRGSYVSGSYALAREFGMSHGAVNEIVTGKTWKHVI